MSYVLWIGASGGLLENTTGGILLAFALVAGISLLAALRGGAKPLAGILRQLRAQRRHVLAVEGLFLLSFAGWALLRAYAPSKIVYAYGEKFMEFAFLNGVLNSAQFPPLDPWLAGYAISYYYFGYVMMALVTRLAGSAPGVGFDLYDALLFALTLSAAYGLAANLVLASRGRPRAAAGAGLLGAVFVGLMGNLEGVIHALYSARRLPEGFLRWLAIPELLNDPQSGSLYPGHGYYQWWWWRASRVLNDVDLSGQPFGAQPITEFPFFSFLLGDNHPHKLALPFVLLAVGLAFNLLLRQIRQARPARRPAAAPLRAARRQLPSMRRPLRITLRGGAAGARPAPPAPLLRRLTGGVQPARLGLWLFYALALGGLGFLNTWDFPIYLGLTLLAYTAGNFWARGGFTRAGLGSSLRLGLALGAAAVALYLPFYAGFSSQAGGVLPYIFPPTRLTQFAVMFGPFLYVCVFFLGGLALAALRRCGYSTATGLRQVGKTWLWVTAASYAPYLLVVGLALALLSGGAVGVDARQQVAQWLGEIEPARALGVILADRLRSPWTYLLVSLLLAAGLTAVLKGRQRAGQHPAGGRPARSITPAALFAALLALSGLTLALAVEFYYLRDTFGLRMNTVFKFYFQAWVLLALATAYGAWWFWAHAPARRAARWFTAAGTAVLTAAGLLYTGMGIVSRAHAFAYPPTLDATATLAGLYPDHWSALPDDWAAVEWLRRQAAGTPVILEAPADCCYDLRGRISAFTGLPTLLGWPGHQYQWRGSSQAADLRRPDIETIYTTPDAQTALDLLRRWNVRFVVLGGLERDYIREACAGRCDPLAAEAKFTEVLAPVFEQGQMTLYLVPPELP